MCSGLLWGCYSVCQFPVPSLTSPLSFLSPFLPLSPLYPSPLSSLSPLPLSSSLPLPSTPHLLSLLFHPLLVSSLPSTALLSLTLSLSPTSSCRLQRSEILGLLLTPASSEARKRLPSQSNPDLATSIREEVGFSLRQHKGDWPCYFLTQLTTFSLPAGECVSTL